jgi:hypothetical protein
MTDQDEYPTRYMAIGRNNITGPVKDTPREAAQAFFERYPTKRICSVTEGYTDGFRWRSVPTKHKYWRDITPSQVNDLLPIN